VSAAIGIDFGETNARAAISRSGTRVIQNRAHEDATPFCVAVRKGKLLIGRYALANALRAPEETIISVRRLMGEAFRDTAPNPFNTRTKSAGATPSSPEGQFGWRADVFLDSAGTDSENQER